MAKLWVHDKRAIQVIALIEPVFHLLLGVCLAHFFDRISEGSPGQGLRQPTGEIGRNPGCRRDGMQVTQRTFAASGWPPMRHQVCCRFNQLIVKPRP